MAKLRKRWAILLAGSGRVLSKPWQSAAGFGITWAIWCVIKASDLAPLRQESQNRQRIGESTLVQVQMDARRDVKLACIGWGSLVWNPGVLRCAGEWRNDGPMLPVEFARVSRDGRLTLVLTEGAAPVQCLWAELSYAKPEEGQAALAGREGCGLHDIGRWPGKAPRHAVGAAEIERWARTNGVDAVVWTALAPNFDASHGKGSTGTDGVLNYLRGLDAATQGKAREYVEQVPVQVITSVRQAIERDLGWAATRESTGVHHAGAANAPGTPRVS